VAIEYAFRVGLELWQSYWLDVAAENSFGKKPLMVNGVEE
jgi:hypothetical protein